MAIAGLNIADPYADIFSQSGGQSVAADPFAQGMQSMQAIGEQARSRIPDAQSQASQAPRSEILFSPTSREFYVNGVTFSEDDDTQIAQADQLLGKPSVGRPQGGDWVNIAPETFGQYIQDIRNPTLGRLFAKNFGIGVDQLQQFAGSALQLAGFEETGGRIVEQQEADLAKTSVYQREFTDISSGGEAVDWFVSILGQQAPMVLESIAAAGVGAAVGTATGGPGLGTAGGAIAGFFSKKAFKDKAIKAAENYRAAKAKGAVPDPADVKVLRNAAGYAGAAGGAYLSNYAIGSGDIYGEMREQGIDPDDTAARVQAWMGAFPYAAADTLGEYVLATRIFGNVLRPRPLPPTTETTRVTRGGKTVTTTGPSRIGQGAELLRRGAIGFGVGAGIEGSTETAQEAIVMSLSGQDLTSDEAVKRFINSFAAGAAVGGTIGGVANLRRGKQTGELGTTGDTETNLLDSSRDFVLVPPPQLGYTPGTGVVPFTTPVTPMGAVRPAPLQLPAPAAPPVTPMGAPVIMVTPEGMAYPDQMLRQTGNVPPGAPGTQGVLDIFGGQIPAQELASRMQPQVAQELPTVPEPTRVPAGQGALQFGQPDPEPTGTMANRLQQLQQQIAAQQQRAEQERAFGLAEQQRAEQQAAEREQQMDLMQQQQQLQIAEQGRIDEQRAALPQPPAELPTRPVPIRQPQQLPLFTPAQAPVPSRGEGLRRGVGTQPVPLAPIEPEPTGRAPRQLPLITQAGQPSVAALKSAGTRGPVSAPIPEVGGSQIPPTGNIVTPATIEAAQKRIALKRAVGRVEYDNGDVYEGQLKKGAPNGEGIYYLANGDIIVGKFQAGEISSGTYNFSDGATYVGSFKDGAFDGQGVFTNVDGSVADGMFKDGAFVPPEPPPVAKKPALKKPAPKKETKAPAPKRDTLKKGKKETKAAAPVVTPTSTVEPFTPKSLAELEAEAAAQRPARETRAELEQELSVSELIDNEIETLETTNVPATFNDALNALVFHAYIDTNSNNAAANTKAREYLEGADIDPITRGQINDALVDTINKKGKVTLHRTKTGFAPVYTYLANNSLMPRLTATVEGLPVNDATRLVRDESLKLTNLPDSTAKAVIKANPDLVAVDAQNVAKGRTETIADNDGTKLAAAIRALNTTTTRLNESTRAQKVADIEAMWDALSDEYRDLVDVAGVPLSSYFDGTKLRTAVINGRLRATVETLSTEQIAEIEADITQAAVSEREAELLRREESLRLSRDPNSALDAYDDDVSSGNYSRDDGSTITAPLAVGRIRMAVTKFINKLVNKPKVTIYKNQADLKAKNPRLYQRAVDSRPQGDFDSASAAGFSFGDGNVIIFSDRIATEQQLNFVLAHETLGHFGLRGIIPANKFDALMNEIYEVSPAIRADVDAAMMANEGMGRAEAVEEYLSDFAGQVDTSIIARVWDAIKGALNKLGIQFGDEAARYFVSQARRYVREGGTGVPFKVNSVMRRLQEVEFGMTPAGTGRYATVAGNTSADTTAGALLLDKVGSLPMNAQQGWDYLKRQGVNNLSSYDKFKAKFLSLANFRARENPGSYAVEELLEQMRNRSMSIKVSMNEKLREVLNKSIYGNIWGISPEQVDQLNTNLYDAQRLAVSKFNPKNEIKRPNLFSFQDGVVTLNEAEFKRLNDAGRITFKQMKDGYSYVSKEIQPDGTFENVTTTVEGISDLTEDSIEWRGYEQLRDAMNDVELQLLRARITSTIAEQKIAFSEIGEFTTAGELTTTDIAFLRKVVNKFKDLYVDKLEIDDRGQVSIKQESVDRAENFAKEFNAALLGESTDRTAKAAAFFDGKVADDFGTYLNEFKTRLKLPKDNEFVVQNRVRELVLAQIFEVDGAELSTRRSIATGYTPILRKGAYQTRVEATDAKTGERVQLKESSRDQLVYSQFESPAESMEYTTMLNDVFGQDKDGNNKVYRLEIRDPNTGEFKLGDVRLEAVSEAALDAVSVLPEQNLNAFVRGLRQLSIVLPPKKMQQVVQAYTRQNSAARNRLERAFVKGASQDGITAITQHIEGRASTIAKTELRPHMAEVMNLGLSKTLKLWNGDSKVLRTLKEKSDLVAADPNASPEAKTTALREYQRYNFMYQSTNPGGGKPRKGMQYYNEASRTMSFLEGNRNVDESDFGSGPLVSSIRAMTSMMQLGASVATGVLNIISAYTNGIPYLASYNEKNSFGGGFGMGPAVAQFHIAASQVGAPGMNPFSESSRAANRAEFYDRMVETPSMTAQQKAQAKQLRDKYQLQEHEAQFIAREIREGVMIPAQSNALVGTARGRATRGAYQKFIDGWMLTFNLTEQSTRRSLGLAAYRLEYQRQKNAGKSDAEAQATARSFAVNALQLTLGEYSVLNRPPAWRSGIQSFLYMYKVYPTTSIQLMSNLSRNGQIGMLSGLFLLSGLAGLPFAEDIEDIVDTLAQKLGFKSGSIRFEIAKFIDNIFPGMSPMVLTGFMNAVSPLPGNLGSRTSLGNVVPGTGMFLAGANTSREMMDIAGPAASALTGSIKSLADAARLPFSDQVSALSVAREAPITMLRAAADAYAYTQAGSIIDRRGYMVSDDMTAGTIAARLLGFYPTAASDQYSMIRVARRMTDYQRDVTTGFRTAWINAMQTGSPDRARAIEDAVREWNNGAKGTALEIRNFRSASMRALREAQRPAGERALRTAPKAARDDMERLSTLLSY